MKPAGDYGRIVVLTGAGVSAESGIRTFRDAGGLWEGRRVEDVASPEGFRRDPAMVHHFYNLRRRQLLEQAEPNAAHRALAEFERRFPGDFLLVTQNVDDLHQRAGSRNVAPMHGQLLKARCAATQRVYDWREDLSAATRCHCCNRPGLLRPHVVWFGEAPLQMDRIHRALSCCELFVTIGTSGHVYPAAGFVDAARAAGATTVELNLQASANSHRFDHRVVGPATKITPEFFLPS